MAGDEGTIAIGGIIGESFAVLRRHPLPILAAAALCYALPTAAWALALPLVASPVDPAHPFRFMGVALLASFVGIAIQAFMQVFVIRIAADDRRGRASDIGDNIGAAVRLGLPLAVLYILAYIAIVLGMVLLLVPGIILALMWAVCGPALVEEGTGIIGAFGRSRALTRGHRWKILGLVLLVFVVIWAVMAVVQELTIGTMSFTQLGRMQGAGQIPLSYTILTVIQNTLVVSYVVVLFTNLWLALRTAKEGPAASQLAEIFS